MNIPGFRNRRRGTARGSSVNGDVGNGDVVDEGDISSSEYARRRRQLMELIKELRDLGADMELELPSIAVIGSQSAGKSSLVEAVSGINVPRNSGTCTRCPMECSLSSFATSWSCDISLRFSYDRNGQPVEGRHRTVPFASKITDKGNVDIWLRRAQAAILNPDLSPASFAGKTLSELDAAKNNPGTLKFSKNAVCITIQDPDATDLSFIDLPGLIQNEEDDVVNLVRSLVVSYIGKSETLILIAIPMSDDMENQQAVRLARDADAEGERTIGILTKPDTLGPGAINSRQKWVEVLQGQAHPLKHGYYCVRLPDDAERSRHVTRAESIQIAAQFFNTSPWNEITDRGRLGIPGFVSDISRLLMRLIEQALPGLRLQVTERLAKCRAEIATLPKPLENEPGVEIFGRIANFTSDLKYAIYGGNGKDKTLIQRNRAVYEMYQGDILGTVPDFRPFTDPENYDKPVYVGSESCETAGNPHPQVQPMGLYDVRRAILSQKAWELPHDIPFDAMVSLIRTFTDLWPEPSLSCFNRVCSNLEEFVESLIKQHFGRFRTLENHIRSLVQRHIEACEREARRCLHKILELESVPHFTLNVQYLDFAHDLWRRRYLDTRRNSSRWLKYVPKPSEQLMEASCDSPTMSWPRSIQTPSAPYQTPEQRALIELAAAGYPNLTREDLERLRPPDGFKDELDMMADVRAYFQVAYKRIVDYVPLTIEHALNQTLANGLQDVLFQELLSGDSSAERMKDLLIEDPDIAAKPERLEAQRQRLTDIQQRLNDFSVGL